MTLEEVGSSTWSREEDKAFENALAAYPENSIDRWENIAGVVPGKTLEEIMFHYGLLVEDLNQIESGRIPLPHYNFPEGSSDSVCYERFEKKGNSNYDISNGDSRNGCKGVRADQERRKGVAWTEDEHRLFLLGLDKYGKGDWRSISRNFVVTRTPTQVASHAQKYFIRLNSINKERRRSSIHDITNATTSPRHPPTGDSSSAEMPTHNPPGHVIHGRANGRGNASFANTGRTGYRAAPDPCLLNSSGP